MEITHKQKDQRRKKWLKLSKRRSVIRFNQKKFVKRFVRYSKESNATPENSTDEFNYYASSTLSDSFDWRKQTRNESSDAKKDVQWKAFEEMENSDSADKSEVRKLFRRNKTHEEKPADANEMWTLTERRTDFGENPSPEDAWKISKMSLPVAMNEKSNKFKMANTNMLWRSLEHIQQLYEEEQHVRELAEIASVEFERETGSAEELENLGENLACVQPGNVRKARLSRWNFLRYDSKARSRSFNKIQKPYSKFFARKKKVTKTDKKCGELADECFNDECSSSTEELCDCSCCSCDTCTNPSTENSADDAERLTRFAKPRSKTRRRRIQTGDNRYQSVPETICKKASKKFLEIEQWYQFDQCTITCKRYSLRYSFSSGDSTGENAPANVLQSPPSVPPVSCALLVRVQVQSNELTCGYQVMRNSKKLLAETCTDRGTKWRSGIVSGGGKHLLLNLCQFRPQATE